MIKVSIISIGDEILIGQTVNSNASYIGEELTKIGFDVIRNFVVGDNEIDILEIFDEAKGISDIIFVTGGLGPTHDDITRKTILKYFNTELVFNSEVLEDIKSLFERRNLKMAEINYDQAMVPRTAEIIRNKNGTAPGLKFKLDDKTFYFMPGVPFEMKGMMTNYIIPELTQYIAEKKIFYYQRVLFTTGITESSLFQTLGDVNSLIGECKLAFLPSQYGVKLRISKKGDDKKQIINDVNSVEQKIKSIIGKYIYSDEDKTLEEVISEILTERNLTLAVAESCTGGLIANRLTNISGSSKYFERGVITYSNTAKVELLNVSQTTLDKFGAVSKETALEMAIGVRNLARTDIGLAITGIMGPTGQTETKPLGLTFIGYIDSQKTFVKRFQFADNRIRNKERASQAALELLRRMLLNIDYEE